MDEQQVLICEVGSREWHLPVHITEHHARLTLFIIVVGIIYGIMFGQWTALLHITYRINLIAGRYVTIAVMPVVWPQVQAVSGSVFLQHIA